MKPLVLQETGDANGIEWTWSEGGREFCLQWENDGTLVSFKLSLYARDDRGTWRFFAWLGNKYWHAGTRSSARDAAYAWIGAVSGAELRELVR